MSDLRAASGNAGGVVQGKGAVRVEEVKRVVPNKNFNYCEAAGASNVYYYGTGDPLLFRDKYDELKREERKIEVELKKQDLDAAKRQELSSKLANLQQDLTARAKAISAYKAKQKFPVHKKVQTDADQLPGNKGETHRDQVAPTEAGAVWVVSIKRTSTEMDVHRLITESTRKDGTLDLKLLGQKRVMVMPQGLRPLLTEIFTRAGLAALL